MASGQSQGVAANNTGIELTRAAEVSNINKVRDDHVDDYIILYLIWYYIRQLFKHISAAWPAVCVPNIPGADHWCQGPEAIPRTQQDIGERAGTISGPNSA